MYTIHGSSLFWLETGRCIQITPPNTCTLYTAAHSSGLKQARTYKSYLLTNVILYTAAHSSGLKQSGTYKLIPPNTCILYTAVYSSDLKQAGTYKSYLLTHVHYTRQLTLLALNRQVHTHHTS